MERQSSVVKPPYYYTLIEILQRKDRTGVSVTSDKELETLRTFCLQNSSFSHHNREKWADFVLENPSDQAAKFMRQYL